jgi:hypothetical protein
LVPVVIFCVRKNQRTVHLFLNFRLLFGFIKALSMVL